MGESEKKVDGLKGFENDPEIAQLEALAKGDMEAKFIDIAKTWGFLDGGNINRFKVRQDILGQFPDLPDIQDNHIDALASYMKLGKIDASDYDDIRSIVGLSNVKAITFDYFCSNIGGLDKQEAISFLGRLKIIPENNATLLNSYLSKSIGDKKEANEMINEIAFTNLHGESSDDFVYKNAMVVFYTNQYGWNWENIQKIINIQGEHFYLNYLASSFQDLLAEYSPTQEQAIRVLDKLSSMSEKELEEFEYGEDFDLVEFLLGTRSFEEAYKQYVDLSHDYFSLPRRLETAEENLETLTKFKGLLATKDMTGRFEDIEEKLLLEKGSLGTDINTAIKALENYLGDNQQRLAGLEKDYKSTKREVLFLASSTEEDYEAYKKKFSERIADSYFILDIAYGENIEEDGFDLLPKFAADFQFFGISEEVVKETMMWHEGEEKEGDVMDGLRMLNNMVKEHKFEDLTIM